MKPIYVYVALAFVASFAGVSWAARGFPVRTGSWQTAVATPSSDDQSKKRENERIMRSLDTIKNEALQAATGFALSPCDSTMKQNLVEAVTAYVHAWQVKLDCPRLANMTIACTDEKLKAAVLAFTTPLDQRLAVALDQAFSQPGITIADFSESIRYDMLRLAALPSGRGIRRSASRACASTPGDTGEPTRHRLNRPTPDVPAIFAPCRRTHRTAVRARHGPDRLRPAA